MHKIAIYKVQCDIFDWNARRTLIADAAMTAYNEVSAGICIQQMAFISLFYNVMQYTFHFNNSRKRKYVHLSFV